MERIVKGIWFPIYLWEADDLSWNEKILLMEIDSFTSQGKDCFISDEYIAELLKVSIRSAAAMVSNLISKGYIKKTRFDGRRRYLESTIAEQLCKICRADMQNLQTTYNNILINSSTKNINNNKSIRYDFRTALLEIGVSPQVAEDWLKVRKEKKAANTETAFKGIQREISKTGLSADECIRLAVENSWCGFKAEWLFNQRKAARPSGKVSVLENNQAVAEELMRMPLKFD
jgi:DNA-binding MarR family transcriptional regulator